MKRVFFIIAIAVFGTFSLRAQTEKGNMIVGGTAGFSSTKTGDSKAAISFSLNPSLRYFVIDRLAIGAELGINGYKFGDSKFSSFGIGPNVRYYLTVDRPVAFFGQAGFSFAYYNNSSDLNDDTNATAFNFGIGGDYFLNDHVAIEAVLGLDSYKEKDATKRTNTFGLQFGVVAFFGGGSGK